MTLMSDQGRRNKSMIHKYTLVAKLARAFDFHSYLEICTATTGHEFKFTDQKQFPNAERAMYYCPEGFGDGAPITYRTAAPSSRLLGEALGDRRYEIVFLDTWHEYHNQAEDLELALKLVAPGGLVISHDCSPPTADYASPQLPMHCHGNAPGVCNQPWSGVTYAAYLDLVLRNTALDYITFDTDHGCGVISKDRKFYGDRPREIIKKLWLDRRPEDQYAVFDQHRAELLRLRPPRVDFAL